MPGAHVCTAGVPSSCARCCGLEKQAHSDPSLGVCSSCLRVTGINTVCLQKPFLILIMKNYWLLRKKKRETINQKFGFMIIYESQPRNLTNKKAKLELLKCMFLCNEQLHIHICFLVKNSLSDI